MAEFKFELTQTDYPDGSPTTTTVEEPKGFGEFNSVLERDFIQGGVFYRFSESNINLEFPGIGRGILKDAWEDLGINAEVTLIVSRRENENKAYEIVYTGIAVMKNKVLTHTFFKVDFEEQNFINKINARKTIPISLESTEDIEGGSLAALTARSTTFAQRKATGTSILGWASGVLYNWNSSGAVDSYSSIFQINQDDMVWPNGTTSVKLEALVKTGRDMTQGYGYLRAPQPTRTAEAVITVDAVIDFTEQVAVTSGTVVIQLRAEDVGAGSASSSVDSFTWEPSVDGTLLNQTVTLTQTKSIDPLTPVDVGVERWRWYLGITTTLVDGRANVTVDSMTIKITSTGEDYASSSVDVYYVHDVLEKVLKSIAPGISFYSNYLGRTLAGYVTDGCLAFLGETNGYKIRTETNHVIRNFADRIKSLVSAFGLGWGLERSFYTNDLDLLRVETYDYFFVDSLLATFTETEKGSYEEVYFDKLNISSVNVGYEKFADDEKILGSKEDYNTFAEYALPLKNLSPDTPELGNTLDLVSKYIASDLLWEVTRQRQFLAQGEAWELDDELFIVDMTAATTIRDDSDLNLSGITNTTSGYNYLLNPKFNLHNNHWLVNSVMWRNTPAELVRNTFYKINNAGAIQYDTSFTSPCLGDTRQFAELQTGDTLDSDIILSDLRSFDRLFTPTKIKFKVRMTSTQADNIFEAHRNGLHAGANYGFIRVTNPDGKIKQGWVLSLRWNIVKEIGEFELIEQYNY